MPKKNTSHLENELKNSTYLDSFLEEHQEELTGCSLPEQLVAMQILSGVRRPSRDKLLSLCFAMKATLEETQGLLKQSGFAPLYVRSHRDSIIIFALTHGHTLIELNTDLYDHGEPVIE